MRGLELRQLREQRGVRAAWLAERLGKRRQAINKIEQKKDVSVSEFVDYVNALGLKPGDLLENSGGVRPDLRQIVDELAELHPAVIARARALLRVADEIATGAALPRPNGGAYNPTSVTKSTMRGDAVGFVDLSSKHVTNERPDEPGPPGSGSETQQGAKKRR